MIFSIKELEPELASIPNEEIRLWTRTILENAPSEFWVKPASSTGKYHPHDERLGSGLVVHTKRAFKVMQIIIDADRDNIELKEKVIFSYDVELKHRTESEMLSAILIHDICSDCGKLHAEMFEPYFTVKLGKDFMSKYPNINRFISCHMGRWSFLEFRPVTYFEKLVHLADNIASKAHLILPAGYNEVV